MLSPLPAITAVIIAILTSFFLTKIFGAPPSSKQYRSLDGLRGYLAFFVFLHHSAIWYAYLRTGVWSAPPSNLYTHFGESSVALFFMITSFLFFSKLIEGRTNAIDWRRLFVSRFFRILPLYAVVLGGLLGVVAYLAGGRWQEPPQTVLGEIFRWLLFRSPDINGVTSTSLIVAGVTWSLGYEALFYVSLPLLAIFTRTIPPKRYILMGLVGVIGGVLVVRPTGIRLVIFLGGIAAALLVRVPRAQRIASTQTASVVVLGLVGLLVYEYPSAYMPGAVVLLSVVFILIACGNNLFGLLELPLSRFMGAMAYSIYLVHGMVLFVTFTFIIGAPTAKEFSPLSHWLVILGATPLLLSLCYATFRLVEMPGMQRAKGKSSINRVPGATVNSATSA